jgi:hypothetical protein
MVDILSSQVVNYSECGMVMRPKPALAMRRWNSTAAYRRWTTRSGLAFGAVTFLDGQQDRQKRTERQAASEPDANAGHEHRFSMSSAPPPSQ